MARASTTSDAFNAVGDPSRRQILALLVQGERPVKQIVEEVRLGQPLVSKHLRVLREVGAVSVRGQGRQRLYRLNASALKPIADWLVDFQQLWTERFDVFDEVLDEIKEKEDGHRD